MVREEQHLRELSIQFLVCTGSKTSLRPGEFDPDCSICDTLSHVAKFFHCPVPWIKAKALGWVLFLQRRCKQFERTEFAALAGICSRNPKRFATKLPHPAVNPPWQATQRQLALSAFGLQRSDPRSRHLHFILWLSGDALHFTIQCSVSVLKHGTCYSLLQTMRNKPFHFSEQTLSGAILQSPLLSVCEQGHALLTTCATPFDLTINSLLCWNLGWWRHLSFFHDEPFPIISPNCLKTMYTPATCALVQLHEKMDKRGSKLSTLLSAKKTPRACSWCKLCKLLSMAMN